MRICRITHPQLDEPRYAALDGSNVYACISDSLPKEDSKPGPDALLLDEVNLVAPVNPSKVVCVGRNYRDHAAELGNKMPDEPLLFLKAPSAVIANADRIELPKE